MDTSFDPWSDEYVWVSNVPPGSPLRTFTRGPHSSATVQGAQGISRGRHLANRGVEVILFLPNFLKMQESVTGELILYSKGTTYKWCLDETGVSLGVWADLKGKKKKGKKGWTIYQIVIDIAM